MRDAFGEPETLPPDTAPDAPIELLRPKIPSPGLGGDPPPPPPPPPRVPGPAAARLSRGGLLPKLPPPPLGAAAARVSRGGPVCPGYSLCPRCCLSLCPGFCLSAARPSRSCRTPSGPAPSSTEGSGCRVQGAGFRDQGAGFRVQGSGCRVQGSLVQGSGFRVQGAPTRRLAPSGPSRIAHSSVSPGGPRLRPGRLAHSW